MLVFLFFVRFNNHFCFVTNKCSPEVDHHSYSTVAGFKALCAGSLVSAQAKIMDEALVWIFRLFWLLPTSLSHLNLFFGFHWNKCDRNVKAHLNVMSYFSSPMFQSGGKLTYWWFFSVFHTVYWDYKPAAISKARLYCKHYWHLEQPRRQKVKFCCWQTAKALR